MLNNPEPADTLTARITKYHPGSAEEAANNYNNNELLLTSNNSVQRHSIKII